MEQSCHSSKDERGGDGAGDAPARPAPQSTPLPLTQGLWGQGLAGFSSASSRGAALKPSYPSTMLLATVTPRFSTGDFTYISHSASYKGALVTSVCVSGNGESHFSKINMLSLSRLLEPILLSFHLPASYFSVPSIPQHCLWHPVF